MIGDQKLNKVIVPPSRIADVPYANADKAPYDYRTYKLQFQAPPQVGVYTFQLLFVSDTFVGEDVALFVPVRLYRFAEDGLCLTTSHDPFSLRWKTCPP